jgi:c-di-GMP-binding flagellar brake protein YcgR
MPAWAGRSNGFDVYPHPLRRRNVRIPCQVLAQVDAATRTVRGMCTDLSLGGMLFLGPPLDAGEKVEVTLDLLHPGAVKLSGEVLERRTPAGGPAMAIRFPHLGPRELKAINRFVAFQLA